VSKPAPAAATPAASTAFTPGLRRFLYLVAALNGAAILIVEILGAKMLSPFFGTSQFVWTAQIAVTLVSLAVGYWFGGRLADRSAALHRLCWCMIAAALYLVATVPLVKPVSFAALKTASLAAGSVMAAIFLFFVPLTLLAVTGPFLVRALIRSTADAGGLVGRVSAISTFGSVGGALLISYVLIPLLPYSVTMFVTAGCVAAAGAGYVALGRRPGKARTGVAAAVIVLVALMVAGGRTTIGASIPGFKEIARAQSDFGLLQVLEHEEGDLRYYVNDLLLQNTYDPTTRQSASLFTYMLHGLANAYAPGIERVLCIGMGVGIVPGQFAREGRRVEVVEINPEIVPIAREHFDLDTDAIELTIGDGRQHLHGLADDVYDALILDAFLGDSSPSHLMTREAFADMRRVLKPDGVLVINAFGRFDAGRDFMAASLDKTLKAVFGSVIIHASGNGNVFYVASDQSPLRLHRELDIAGAHRRVRGGMQAALAGIMRPRPDSGRVLTDDYNPVEFRDAANRERFRRDLTAMMLNR
jgi:spermidine synthase